MEMSSERAGKEAKKPAEAVRKMDVNKSSKKN